MIQDEHIKTLIDLGLSLLQAKTYLNLTKLRKANVQTIAKASNMARQDIYRIMPTLEKLGLAEKMVASPTIYEATPIKEGYYILLQNKTQEHTELQKKTIALIRNLHESNDKTTLQDEGSQFVVTSSKSLLFKRLDERDNTAQTSIDAINSWKGNRDRLFYRLQGVKRALKRGVKIRVITEKHEDDKSLQKIAQTLKTNPLFEIRYLSTPTPIKTVIHDGREVHLSTANPRDNADTPSLWSNNPQFVKVMVTYFEDTWNQAAP